MSPLLQSYCLPVDNESVNVNEPHINSNNANNLTACLTWRLPNNQNIMIDRNIRHAISTIQNNIQMDELLNHHKMSYLKNGILHANIDLYWTKIWLKWNPFEKLTSQQLSKTIGKCIRTIT